jgi:glycosyltransferase involved in cell wall biosynthesis
MTGRGPLGAGAAAGRPVKLVIQIPCYNEDATLGTTLAALPKHLPGIDEIAVLVVNDGSEDRTLEVAREQGVAHVVDLRRRSGLARAFMAGLEASLAAQADVIVNTDADNQYCAEDIERLVEPILSRRADLVIGARPIDSIPSFSPLKRRLQRLGSRVVRLVSGTDVPDATSGFRALSREAALHLNVFDDYTYTLETIIAAARRGIPIESVPIRVNPPLRPSRLIRSVPRYVARSVYTILRIPFIYAPLKFFAVLGAVPFGLGFLLGVRWVYLYLQGGPRTHVPSLILAAVLLLMGFLLWILGLIGDLLAVNRRLLEDIQVHQRRIRFGAG